MKRYCNMSAPVYLYMVVTDDEYELPLIVCDTIRELARCTGVDENSISCGLARYEKGIHKHSKYRRVLVEDYMKEVCKNCIHCKETYRAGYCERKKKRVKRTKETCEEWSLKK